MIVNLRLMVFAVLALAVSACATNVVAQKASRFEMGTAAYDAGDYTTAYVIWEKLAREDDLAAMRNTAQLLRQGKGVPKDSKRAFELYLAAADKGLVTAMANVGEMYLLGEGVDKDERAAAGWYARAASAGLSIAQVKLSEMFEQGVGVPRDPVRARELLQRAARNGYAPAQAKLREMGVVPEPSGVPVEEKPINLDDPWRGGGTITGAFNRPGMAVVAPATVATGMMSPGEPVPEDVVARMPANDVALMNAAATAYAAQNRASAFAAWRTVASRGNPEAQIRVGIMYAQGDGVGQDMIEAYRWLRLAGEQGHPRAAAELSVVAAQLAPAERAIAESLVKNPVTGAPRAP